MSQKGRNWPSWQARDKKEGGFTCIPKSVENSPAFQELSGNQIRLLFRCWRRGDYRANDPSRKHLPRDDYPGIDKYRRDEVFYMGLVVAVNYGLYKPTNRKYYTDMKVLEKVGFIERLSTGKKTQSLSIYKLSDKWQSYRQNN